MSAGILPRRTSPECSGNISAERAGQGHELSAFIAAQNAPQPRRMINFGALKRDVKVRRGEPTQNRNLLVDKVPKKL